MSHLLSSLPVPSNLEAFATGVQADYALLHHEIAQQQGETLVIDRSAATPRQEQAQGVAVGVPCVADGLGGDAAPPLDNMGVQITESRVDWLSFTVSATDELSLMGIVAEWSSKLGGAVPLERGRYGYPSARAVLGTGVILWNPERLEMGVHIELPSKALGLYSASSDGATVYSILLDAMGQNAKFKRLDVCSDNMGVHISAVVAAVQADQLVTKSRTVTLMQNLRGSGCSLYIGSPQSERRVRFYDKAAEQGIDDGSIWTRAEVQLRNDLAHQTVIALLVDDTALESVISSAVDFRLQDDSNTTRRTRCEWWQSWLGCFSRFRYAVSQRISIIGDAVEWIQKQVAPTLAYIFQGVGYDFAASWLIYTISAASSRIPPYRASHLALLES
jgi:hypothetical protein